MKQITNASQLTPEDNGTVVEVLQYRYYDTRAPEYTWERGIVREVVDAHSKRKEITLVTKFDNDVLAKNTLYTTRGTNSLPNTTLGENQGSQGLFRPDNAKEYFEKLNGIEPERKATKEELERLLVA